MACSKEWNKSTETFPEKDETSDLLDFKPTILKLLTELKENMDEVRKTMKKNRSSIKDTEIMKGTKMKFWS